jgi:DNA-binding NarL/FixJ family response regulator
MENQKSKMQSDKSLGLLLTDDMIFSSRIIGTAKALNLEVKQLKSVADLIAMARESAPTCIIVDLSHPGLQVDNLIRDLKEFCSPMPRLVAYGSHVDAASLRAARDAGCDVVLPRSQFVEQLPSRLGQWLAPIGSSPTN